MENPNHTKNLEKCRVHHCLSCVVVLTQEVSVDPSPACGQGDLQLSLWRLRKCVVLLPEAGRNQFAADFLGGSVMMSMFWMNQSALAGLWVPEGFPSWWCMYFYWFWGRETVFF